MTDAAPLLVLVAGPRGRLRDAVIAILDSSEMFELARCVDAADAVVTACRERRIDVLVLDEDIAGGDARRLAQRLALERPIPTLLLVRDVAMSLDQDEIDRRLRLFRLGKHQVQRNDSVSQKLISSRLNLLAARSREARATITRRELEDVLEELREEENELPVHRPGQQLLEHPLEVVLIGGTVDQIEVLAHIVRSVQGSRIPIIVAIEGQDGHAKLRAAVADHRVRLKEIDRAASIRKLDGTIVVTSDRRAVVSSESLLVGLQLDPGLNLTETLGSMVALGHSGCVVATTPIVDAVQQTFPTLSEAGCRVLIVEDSRRGGELSIGSVVVPCVGAADLGWLLGNALPKRI